MIDCIDYEEVMKLDPSITVAVEATKTLPPRIKEQQEREKEEMMGMLFFTLYFDIINRNNKLNIIGCTTIPSNSLSQR